jgi:3-dehydroquinate synthase
MTDSTQTAKRIPISFPGGRYEVIIGATLLSMLGQIVRQVSPAKRAALITDPRVGALYTGSATQSLTSAGFDVIAVELPAGEPNKRLATLIPVYDSILESHIDRQTPIIALGGGIVGDMAGLVAGTLLRGLPFVQVPTTLLAMVDASVGGKAAVNSSAGKNLIGVFHQPAVVVADTSVLTTLSDEEFRNGLAECIKHDAIRDVDGFTRLEGSIDRALDRDIDYLAELVVHNVTIKARVIEADPYEQGDRAHLNFGHTFGHAIEQATGHAVTHGQAVALGMVAAARLSRDLGMLTADDAKRIERLIARVGLPTHRGGLSAQAVTQAMSVDKKIRDGKPRLVLLQGIGHAIVRDDVPISAIERAAASLRGHDGD